MGIFGEIANEAALDPVIKAIAHEYNSLSDPEDSYTGRVLRKLGRIALEQLDWPSKDYSQYYRLFKECE